MNEKMMNGSSGPGHDRSRAEHKAEEPSPNVLVAQLRRPSDHFRAVERNFGDTKPNGVEENNRVDVLPELNQAGIKF